MKKRKLIDNLSNSSNNNNLNKKYSKLKTDYLEIKEIGKEEIDLNTDKYEVKTKDLI